MEASNLGSGSHVGRQVGSELGVVWDQTHMEMLDSVAIFSTMFVSLCVAEACRLTNLLDFIGIARFQ